MARRYGGTSLGLAITKELVEMMGGSLEAASEPGRGSEFRFRIPLVASSAPVSSPVPTDPAGLHGKWALVVDDNPTNAAVVEAHLHQWGMRVSLASDGMKALAMLREWHAEGRRTDVALIDMKMPVMDGIELAERLREQPWIAPKRLVMLTSVATDDEARRARAAGIDHHVAKPVRQQELLRALIRQADAPASRPAPSVALGARVLVAEDNVVNQEVVRSMLEGLGCHATIAASGVEALAALADERFDMVFMDCQMPEMAGFEAVRRFRDGGEASANPNDLPIVALTANALVGDADRCLAAGFDDYVSKPFTQRQIEGLVRKWARGERDALVTSPGALGRAETTSAAAPVLDDAAVDELRRIEAEAGSGLVERVLKAYTSSAATLISTLIAALGARDAAAASMAAHSLKSSSANVGAFALSELCATIENLAQSRRLGEAVAHISELERQHARVAAAIDALEGSVRRST